MKSSPSLLLICLCAVWFLSAPASAADPTDRELHEIVLEPDLVIGNGEDGVLLHKVNSVVVDSRGDLYLGDYGLSRVDHFSESGEFLGKFGSRGAGPGELMDYFVMGIDGRDRLAFVGSGGRVTLLDTKGSFLDEFTREEQGPSSYSLKFDASGKLYIVSPIVLNHQVIQVYQFQPSSHQWKLLRSFGDTYAVGENVDVRDEGFYAAGFLDIGPDGALYYVQKAPYELRKYSPEGKLLARTRKGAGDFVPPPPATDYTHGSFKIAYPGGADGIAVRPDGLVLTTSHRRHEDGRLESLLCCYDSQLRFLVSKHLDQGFFLKTSDSKGRIFVGSLSDTGPLITRYRLRLR